MTTRDDVDILSREVGHGVRALRAG